MIEAQLAHAMRDSLGRAYNRTEFEVHRRLLMQTWTDYLDKLRSRRNPNLVGLHKVATKSGANSSQDWPIDAKDNANAQSLPTVQATTPGQIRLRKH